ncbi:FUSC family protein [Actinoplanes sp. NPDC051851]|uniref:FUSC family protein n=1 Tax=Actinoplanes sp. NPDC051851 TaxID=3154753 RepID=UPI00342728AB
MVWGILRAAGPAAVRAGVSVAVPLAAVLVVGRPEWAMYAAFGAFTSLYGRNRVHLSRLVMQASAAAALVTAVLAGVLVGALRERSWPAVIGAAVVAGVGMLVAGAADWHPPGAMFLVFAFGAVASVSHRLADVPLAVSVAVCSAGFSLVVGNAVGMLRRAPDPGEPGNPRHPHDPAPERHSERPAAGGSAGVAGGADVGGAVRGAVAALVAGSVATGVGIGHPYWATVAAVAPLSARGVSAQLGRAGHRIAGTLAGLVVAAAVLSLGLSEYPAVVLLAFLQVGAELLVGRHYGAAMVLITPLALLMNQVVAPRPIGQLLWDRGVETVVGGLVACAVILGSGWLTRRRQVRGEI